jgi:ABC-2 type transport system permease protein
MLTATWSLELPKLFKRRMTWVLALILAVLIVTLDVSVYATLHNPDALQGRPPEMEEYLWATLCWPTSFSDLLNAAAGNNLGGLMLVILAGAMVAQEYSWRTTHLWLGHGVSRRALLGSKFVTLALACLLFVLVPLAVGAPLTAWFTHQHTGALSLGGVSLWGLVVSTLRTTYTLLPYVALTLMVAVMTRSTTAAIGVGLAWALLVEQIVRELLGIAGGVWANVPHYLPGGLAEVLIRLNRQTFGLEMGLYGGAGELGMEPWAATLGIALYTAVFLGVAYWVFRRQDLTE